MSGIATTVTVILTGSCVNEGDPGEQPNEWLARVINLGLREAKVADLAATAIGGVGDLLLVDWSPPKGSVSIATDGAPRTRRE